MELTSDTLLKQIYFVRFGESPKENTKLRFFNDLQVYQQVQKRAGGDPVSVPAIRSWTNRRTPSVPKRAGAMRFLRGYLLWIDSKGLVAAGEKPRATLNALMLFLNRYEAETSSALSPIVARAFQTLLVGSDRNPRPVDKDLFHDGSSKEPRDHSYFLLYRHSTNRGAVLKSFLVCQKPERELVDSYGFNHFIWGGRSSEFQSHVFRECEGLVIKLEKSYYFLGYNFSVPVDKRRDPDEYARQRHIWKKNPNGMGLISVEFDEIDHRPGLFGGLTMTIAAARQPIVARVVFLHLGTKGRTKIPITDFLVEPTELYPHKVADDLRQTIDRINTAGCERFGSHLDPLVRGSNWKRRGAFKLAREIVTMIDNVPQWEKKQRERDPANKIRTRVGELTARGAIETFGQLRD
jgi:hypothetical protein